MAKKIAQPKSTTDRNYSEIALKYCTDIISGAIPACRYVKLACSRHVDDLAKSLSPDYPYRFDDGLANKRCRFSEKLTHTKGKLAGKLIKLEPHQIFMQACLYPWTGSCCVGFSESIGQ